MGAWGPAVFSDDVACDVRDSYKKEVANGVDGAEATRIVLANLGTSIEDSDDGPVIWLALAATQWKLGRLQDDVKIRALEMIDTRAGLDLWEGAGPKALEKRKAALQKLRDQLLSPQPPVRNVRKRFSPAIYADLQTGDAISYQMHSGDYLIFRCVDSRPFGMELPRFDLLDWAGASVPDSSRIARMPYAKVIDATRPSVFFIFAHRKRDFPADRVQVVAHGLRIHQPAAESHCCWGLQWETIEADIQQRFRLKRSGPSGLSRWFGGRS